MLPPVPDGVAPVIRFRNPPDGAVTWDDLVKGPITISNREIDDLVIVRADGVPTYNFAVVVDDWDMAISHVFRGDEHVNNTPWQINIFNALGAPLPLFGHVPVILGDDGQKLSKRRGAVSVTAYEEAGYLPEAMLNYLARLGWSHGDEELFTREQMVEWFDGSHLPKSPAQWDPAKLAWVNAHYIKHADDARWRRWCDAQLARRGIARARGRRAAARARVRAVQGPLRHHGRARRLAGDVLRAGRAPATRSAPQHVTAAVRPALRAARQADGGRWTRPAIAAAIKETLAAHGLKMPQLAPALRVLVCGRAQTPSIDAVLALFPREAVLERLRRPARLAIIAVSLELRWLPVHSDGGIAQLGERLHGMQEVSGSIPLTSTNRRRSGRVDEDAVPFV